MSAVRPLIQEAQTHPRNAASPVFSDDARRSLERDGLFGLGESYIRGEWDASELDVFIHKLATSEVGRQIRLRGKMFGYALREKLKNPQIGRGAFEVAERHYDLGNDLFSAMLDSTMSYTCGYWKDASNLEQAQLAKLQMSCHKLQLEPGMRVLDIGCGWGNWAEFAAKNYGVTVVGLTVSKEQAHFARERCEGLPVEIVLEDYRNYSGSFDRIVSIEMIEAVGRRNIPGFFDKVQKSLKPNGLFLLQVISGESFGPKSPPALDQFVVWLLKHIFPNGYLPKMRELTDPARNGFVIEDIHNFAADYDKTLLAWDERFETAWSGLQTNYDERFRRMWRYYLNGCAAMFRARLVQLYQIVYSKGLVEYKRYS